MCFNGTCTGKNAHRWPKGKRGEEQQENNTGHINVR